MTVATTASTFVLPQHTNKDTLKRLYCDFKTRVTESADGNLLLRGMHEALTNRDQHCLIYWPRQHDEWHTKTCVYDQTYERGKASAVSFHLVYLTTLLAKLNKTVTHFLDCHCHNHSRDIAFDWHEFIYPQFVTLLAKRLFDGETPSDLSAPPTPPSPFSLSKERIETERHHIEPHIYQHRAADITSLLGDAFHCPSEQLLARYHKESALTQFGVDTLQGMRHFGPRHVTTDDYKLAFTRKNVKVRAPFLVGGALELKACGDDALPYVVICSNFTLRMPLQGGHKVYHLYVPGRIAKRLRLVAQDFGERRRIESRDLCGDNYACMIISRAPLRIEFKGTTGLLLVTPGVCKFDLDRAVLEMWSTSSPSPCAYEIESVDRVMPRKSLERRAYFECLHATYHALFTQSEYTPCRPCIGHVTFDQPSLHTGARAYTSESFINQYGSFADPLPSPREIMRRRGYKTLDLTRIRVQFLQEDETAMPLFFTHDEKPLIMVEQEYEFSGKRYVLYGLCEKKGDPVACFFKLNARRDYLLFIPIVYQC